MYVHTALLPVTPNTHISGISQRDGHTHIYKHTVQMKKKMRHIICKHTDTVLQKNVHLWPRAVMNSHTPTVLNLHKAHRGITQTQQQTQGQWVTYTGNTDTASSLLRSPLGLPRNYSYRSYSQFSSFTTHRNEASKIEQCDGI